MTLKVGKAVAGIYTAATQTAPAYGDAVTVNALLLGATGVAAPSGTVAFSEGVSPLGTTQVGSDGRASLVLGVGGAAILSVGTHSITGVYSGDANYLTATAPALAITVAKTAANVALTSTPAQVSQPVILKAAVTLASGSAATVGAVDFTNGGRAIAGLAGGRPVVDL